MKRIVIGIWLMANMLPVTNLGAAPVELGPRPFYLIDQMAEGALKQKLRACADMEFTKRDFSIGHRGAPLQFPEHSRESYMAAARMGAGILECDVTFTKDKQLVCRHGQNDLHTTTNIVTSDLAVKCHKPFQPAREGQKASAECRTSDLTLAEFETLTGKMDAADKTAETAAGYVKGTAGWRTDLYAAQTGRLMTHADSIALFKELGVKFTPELKAPVVEMPFEGMTQADYAQKLIDEYKAANIPPQDVFPQSFNLADIQYWIQNEPEFGKQAVYLDSSYRRKGFNPQDETTFEPSMQELADMGVRYLAPPIWMLLAVEEGKITPSVYAKEARKAGLSLISWSLERSGPLVTGGGWYYKTVNDVIKSDGDMMIVLDVLVQQVGIVGLFSDWPATTSYYANCFDLK